MLIIIMTEGHVCQESGFAKHAKRLKEQLFYPKVPPGAKTKLRPVPDYTPYTSNHTLEKVVSIEPGNCPESIFPMSTAFDARRRPSLWSYLSFNSSSRKRSGSLPKHETPSPETKENTPPRGNWGRAGNLEGYKEASMTSGQRARLLKTGGVIAFVVLLLYLFTSGDGAGVRDMVKGMLDATLDRTSPNVAYFS